MRETMFNFVVGPSPPDRRSASAFRPKNTHPSSYVLRWREFTTVWQRRTTQNPIPQHRAALRGSAHRRCMITGYLGGESTGEISGSATKRSCSMSKKIYFQFDREKNSTISCIHTQDTLPTYIPRLATYRRGYAPTYITCTCRLGMRKHGSERSAYTVSTRQQRQEERPSSLMHLVRLSVVARVVHHVHDPAFAVGTKPFSFYFQALLFFFGVYLYNPKRKPTFGQPVARRNTVLGFRDIYTTRWCP
ncbi:hypothetical protein EV127DRAFT_235881 [Xylaria flabelliformis]|nr:hypothetical protein EV127DRAFT_235881 [Xylaria flabelliformis]